MFWKDKLLSTDNIMPMLVEMHMKLVYFNWKNISFSPTLLVPLSSSADVSRDVVSLSRRSLSFHTIGKMLPVEAAKQPFKKLNHTPSQNTLGKGCRMMFVIFRRSDPVGEESSEFTQALIAHRAANTSILCVWFPLEDVIFKLFVYL